MSNTDFDPDAYLAAAPKAPDAGFDPDKYLGAQPQSFGDKLMQAWPVKAAQTLYSAATLPGDVATGAGNVAPTTPGTWSDEDEARLQLNNAGLVDRSRSLAAVASPASVAARAGEGIFGTAMTPSVVPKVATPTIPEGLAAAKALYESPVVKEVKIAGSTGPRLADEIQGNLSNELGVDENLAPKTFGILNKLKNMPQPEEGEPDPFLTVANLRSLRRTLGNAAGSIDPTERLAAKSSMQHLDEYLANMPDADVIAGNPTAASAILKEANANYAAMKAATDFDVRMTRAQLRAAAANSGMNVGNTIRQRMADIIVTPKLARQFNPDELAQMKSIVEGTPMTNATRYAGNVLGGGGGMLAALYGLGHAGVAPIAGYFLRKMGNFQTTQAAKALNEAVRMRSPLGQQRAADALAQAQRPNLAPLARGVLPAATQPGSPLLQLPAAVEANSQQNGVPGVPEQQKDGGRIEQQRATGGKVRGESGHKGQVESKSADKSSTEKATKTKANYRGGTANKRCGLCDMFRPPSGCVSVRGIISPQALCDYFEPKRQERANGGRVDAANIEHEPSEAQKEAGNYAKDHVRVHGLDISIENAKGHYRRGVGRDGKPWSVKMPAHYGYIKGTVGKDKDHVDVYLGPHLKSPTVFVVDQVDHETRKFDEHKAFLGFASPRQVTETYQKAFSDGKGMQRLGHLTGMSIEEFKNWLATGDMKKKADDHFDNAVKIDTTHDGPWMSCMSIDGATMYRNKNIPATANIKGKTVDVDDMLLHHEVPEREDLEKLIAEFKVRFKREPNTKERKAIYLKAHNRSGTPNERAHAKKIGVDWKAWSAWCRGEEAKIEKMKFTNQPKDADVKPIPHSHGDLEAEDKAA